MVANTRLHTSEPSMASARNPSQKEAVFRSSYMYLIVFILQDYMRSRECIIIVSSITFHTILILQSGY